MDKQNSPEQKDEKTPKLLRYPSKSNFAHNILHQNQKEKDKILEKYSEQLKYLERKDHPNEMTNTEAPDFSRENRSESSSEKDNSSLLWHLMSSYISNDIPAIQRQISDHIEYTLARDRSHFDVRSAYEATAYSVHDRLIEFWNDTNFRLKEYNPKRVYYMSIEYLMGRTLQNALLNLGIEDRYSLALKELGYSLENLYESEVDAGLGNGGLGRLAACYLDSLATQNYAAWGYGIRYTYGMFRQDIYEGWQVEIPDLWLKYGDPWEITRSDVKFFVRFYGTLNENHVWEGGETVIAVAHDNPIPGFGTTNTLNLRLWSSEPSTEFDLQSFNEGNYYKAIEKRQRAETLSSVLYPNDNTPEGKELRLKQQYFFCSATLQDILRRFKRLNGDSPNFKLFPEKVAIQLNDTHPTIAIAELIRLLVDVEHVQWDDAIAISRETFAYTNHTVLPEALERWSVPLLETVLPRHLRIIYMINFQFLENEVKPRFGEDPEILREMSIVEESFPKTIRMAHLAIIMSHRVNGVARIHTDILCKQLFARFHQLYPEKFINITNGITPRRWLLCANRPLANLIERTLGGVDFLRNLEQLAELKNFVSDPDLQSEWMQIKRQNKQNLANYLRETFNIEIDSENALFDVQVKRIHEYKRQLLNALRVVYEYLTLQRKAKADQLDGVLPKVIIFAGKAAPGYRRAKLIIKLICSIANRVNQDSSIRDLLKIIFIPNYNVSLAEKIVPASDISEHISTAGMEASGTSNMKFALNGGLIIGTLDGANIEIRDCIGEENMFTFGLTATQVIDARNDNAKKQYLKKPEDPRLQEVFDYIRAGEFGPSENFEEILQSLEPSKDYYLLGEDFASYLDCHKQVEQQFRDKPLWAKKSILSTAGMGFFTSDRSIQEYATKIWHVKPQQIPVKKQV